MRWIIAVLLVGCLPSYVLAAGEPVRMDVPSVGAAQVIDGGRAVLVLSWSDSGGSSWTTIDAATGKVIKRADVAQVSFRGAAVARDAGLVVIRGKNHGGAQHGNLPAAYLATWDVKAAKELWRAKEHADAEIIAAAMSPDGTRVLTACGQRPSQLWDARAGTFLRDIDPGRDVTCVALSADGKQGLLAGGDRDEDILLWDLERDESLRRFTGHHGKVTFVTFWPDDRKVLSASEDGTIRLWDTDTGAELRRLRGPDGSVALVAPYPDGRRLLAASDAAFGTFDPMKSIMPARNVRAWDMLTGAPLGEPRPYHDYLIECLGFGPGGNEAVATIHDYHIQRWPVSAAPPAAEKEASFDRARLPDEPEAQVLALSCEDTVEHMGFLPNGHLFTLGEHAAVTRWDLARGIRIGVFAPPADARPIDKAIDVSGDGRLGASGNGSNGATVWELASGLRVCEPRIEDDDVVVVEASLSPDGKLIALGTSTLDSKVQRLVFFHTSDGAAAGKVELPGYCASPLAFSPDGGRVAVVDLEKNDSIGIFDLDTGKQTKTLRLPKGVGGKGSGWMLGAMRFSADGSRLMTEPCHRLVCWSVEDGTIVGDVPVPLNVSSVALSPDGKRALTGGQDSNVRLWDLATKKQIAVFDHPRGTPIVTFSRDGKQAIAAGSDRMLRVFRLPD